MQASPVAAETMWPLLLSAFASKKLTRLPLQVRHVPRAWGTWLLLALALALGGTLLAVLAAVLAARRPAAARIALGGARSMSLSRRSLSGSLPTHSSWSNSQGALPR